MGFWGTLGDVFLGPDGISNNAYQQIQGPQQYNQATQRLGQMANASAPQVNADQISSNNMLQSRANLNGTATNLAAIASGQQQGAGQIAVNRQVGAAQAQQAAQAQAARGGNAALAMRNAARNQADIGMQGAGQAAQAQQSDQLAANQQLGSIYGNMYNQDAQTAAQTAFANQNANLQQQGLQQQALGQQLGWDQATINEQIAKTAAEDNQKGIGGSFLSAVGGIIGARSDVRVKHDIADGQDKAMTAVQTLAPVTFAYNDPRDGVGPQLGTTAQDLEKAGLGHVVVDAPGGKIVDGAKLATANTAMIAALGNRLAQIEGGKPGAAQGQPPYDLVVGAPRPTASPAGYSLVVGAPIPTRSPSAYGLEVGAPVPTSQQGVSTGQGLAALVAALAKRSDSSSGTPAGKRQ